MEKISPIISLCVEKINNNSFLSSLKKAIIDLLPIIITVSIISFMNQYMKIDYLTQISQLLCTLFSFILIVGYCYHYTQDQKQKFILFTVLALLFSYLFNTENNLLLALPSLIGIHIIFALFNYALKLPHYTFKVPQAVNDYLHNISIIFCCVVIVGMMSYLFTLFTPYFLSISTIIFSIFNSLYMVIIVVLITLFFWSTGMHGVAFIGTVCRPFWIIMLIINLKCMLSGEGIPYIAIEPFYQWFIWIGGSGTTLGLAFLLRFFARSTHLKQLGKDSFSSGIVNINEQLIFGMPIALNKCLLVPFILTPILCALISYYYISQHASIIYAMPWVFPFFIGGFLSGQGNNSLWVLLLGLFLLSIIIYLPFFIYSDYHLKKEGR